MEMELNSLIDKIKKEGVEQAEKDAGNIIKEAQARAREIAEEAEKTKAGIIKEGKSQVEKLKKAAEKSLEQASRDVLLTLRERVIEFFDRILKDKVSEELEDAALKDMIIKAVSNFKKDGVLDIEILLNDKDKAELKKTLFSALSQEAKAHIKLTSGKGIKKGFRIGKKDKDSYLDFTDEAITEAFKQYLNPKLAEMLDIDLGLNK